MRLIGRITLHYSRQHTASLDMAKGHYTLEIDKAKPSTEFRAILKIAPFGSIYKVTQVHYYSDAPAKEFSWLATSGWHSNGHLIGIGQTRYCIFDALHHCLYLEVMNDDGDFTVETYFKN